MSYMCGICSPPKRLNYESRKSGFRFDLKNPPRVWILWIHDPLLDLPEKRKIRFWMSFRKSGFGLSQKNAPLLSFANQIEIKSLQLINSI